MFRFRAVSGAIAAGLSAEETIDFVFDWHSEDYIDLRRSELLKIPLHLGKGSTGVPDMEIIERPTTSGSEGCCWRSADPFYANIWDGSQQHCPHGHALDARYLPGGWCVPRFHCRSTRVR